MAAPVNCPSCGHEFVPAADPDLEGWSRRTGNRAREPWDTGRSGGVWRRVRMLVAVLTPEFKPFTRRAEMWSFRIVCHAPELELYDRRPGPNFLCEFYMGGSARSKIEAQKAALKDARRIVEMIERGELELVWAHCRHGRTSLRSSEVGRRWACLECQFNEDEIERAHAHRHATRAKLSLVTK